MPIIQHQADVVILGSGFSGSLMAQILCSTGRSVILVDHAAHPRFAIGESSTPAANLILRELAKRYGLRHLEALSSYGRWQRAYPEIGCGIKRGFSYFKHDAGEEFHGGDHHQNELLVAASRDEINSDTHWLRADVDQFLCKVTANLGVLVLENTELTGIQHEPGTGLNWHLDGRQDGETITLQARFLVDATGAGGLLGRFLQIPGCVDRLQTDTRAIYTHCRQVGSWADQLRATGGSIVDHPFPCDHAAQHHLVEDGWIWMLRFNQGTTSVGLMIDQSRRGSSVSLGAQETWDTTLSRFPSVGRLLLGSTLAESPGHWIQSGRLQRLSSQVVGPDWAMLPHTAGFIDPLHSMGIAHTLSGVERLARILEGPWDDARIVPALKAYENQVLQEFVLMDHLVAGSYWAINHFPWFISYCMLYFVSVIQYEQRRLVKASGDDLPGSFLGADQADWLQVVRRIWQQLKTELDPGAPSTQPAGKFEQFVWEALKPFDPLGLKDPEVRHMYPHTAPW